MEEEILIDVRFDVTEFTRKAAQYQKSIADMRAQNKELRKDIQAGTETSAESARQLALNDTAIRENTASLRAMNAQITASEEANKELGDSLIEQRALLRTLNEQYASLSKAQRESAQGTELQSRISELNTEIKDTEVSLGQFGRKVGDYPNFMAKLQGAIAPVIGVIAGLRAAFQAAQSTIQSTQTTGDAFNTSVAGISASLGVLRRALASTDFSLFIRNARDAARAGENLAIVLDSLFERQNSVNIRRSQQQTELASLREQIANVNLSLEERERAGERYLEITRQQYAEEAQIRRDAADAQLQYVASIIKGVYQTAEAAGEEFAAFVKNYNLNKDLIDQANEYLSLQQQINASTAATYRPASSAFTTVSIVNNTQRIEDLRQELTKYDATVVEVAETLSRYNLTNDELVQGYVDAEVAANNAEAAFAQSTREITNQLNTIRKAANAEAATASKEQRDAELQAQYQLQDQLLATIQNGVESQIQAIEIGAERQIATLRRRLETETNLTRIAREAISQTIIQIEANTAAQIQEIRDENERIMSERAINAEVERLNLEIDAIRNNNEERLNLQRQRLQIQREQELSNIELTEQERANIITRYNAQEIALRQAANQALQQEQAQAMANEFEARRQALLGQNVELAELEQERALLEQQQLLELDEETKARLFENQALYEAALLESNNRVRQATIGVMQSQQTIAENQAKVFGAVATSIGNVFTSVAGDNEKFAVFNKTLALATASVELGLSIAAATKTASISGDPYTIAIRIASAVAGVVSAFAGVISSINSSKIPQAPTFGQTQSSSGGRQNLGKYEEGGIVPGNSYHGDNIIARVNSGEMILNARQQATLFEMANNRVAEPMFDYDRLQTIVNTAVNNMPPPVLDYEEFTNFTNNLTTIREYENV